MRLQQVSIVMCLATAMIAACVDVQEAVEPAEGAGVDESVRPALVERSDHLALLSLPGVRELGTFEVEVRTGFPVAQHSDAEWKSGSQALPGMEDGHAQNRNPGNGAQADTFRLVQDAGGNGLTEAACEVFWTSGWADPNWRFHVPEAARTSFLDDLHAGGPGAGATGDGNRFCTNFDLTNDFSDELRDVWIVVDGFNAPGVRGFVSVAPRTWPSEVDGEPDVVLEPWSQQGLFRYKDMAPGETVRFQWYFYFGDAEVRDFSVRGRLVEILHEECGNGEDNNGDGLADSGCGQFPGGAECLSGFDCVTGVCNGGSALDGEFGVCAISNDGGPCHEDTDCTGGACSPLQGSSVGICAECPDGHHVTSYVDAGNFTCTPIDHCAEGTDLCAPEATCAYWTPGRYNCFCPEGYIGSGFHCYEETEGRFVVLGGAMRTDPEVSVVLMEPNNLVQNWGYVGGASGWTVSTETCTGCCPSGTMPCNGFEANAFFTGLWMTSHTESSKSQVVNLEDFGFTDEHLDGPDQLPVVIREYVTSVPERYHLDTQLRDEGGATIVSNTVSNPSAQVAERVYTSYPDGMRQVWIRSRGRDTVGWGGHFGTRAVWPIVRVGEVDTRYSLDGGDAWTDWAPFEAVVDFSLQEGTGLRTILLEMRDWKDDIFEHRIDILLYEP